LSYEIQFRADELDITEAQVWYEMQQIGSGADFRSEIPQVFDRLAETPLIYQIGDEVLARARDVFPAT
jgi:hypothetical protein